VERAVHISEAARRLGITPEHLRNLERAGRIPKPRRDYNGRVYSESDLAVLKALGVGDRPRKLKQVEEVLGAGS
jgi:DNA-binding transcriptional MerR regulator